MATQSHAPRRNNKFPTQPAVEDGSLISGDTAASLMRLFKVFSNDTRLWLSHALVRDEESCVSKMADALGMKPQAVSIQLQRLAGRGIPGTRRSGPNTYYRVVGPCAAMLLERGLCLIQYCPE